MDGFQSAVRIKLGPSKAPTTDACGQSDSKRDAETPWETQGTRFIKTGVWQSPIFVAIDQEFGHVLSIRRRMSMRSRVSDSTSPLPRAAIPKHPVPRGRSIWQPIRFDTTDPCSNSAPRRVEFANTSDWVEYSLDRHRRDWP